MKTTINTRTRTTRSTGKLFDETKGIVKCRVCGQEWWWMRPAGHVFDRGMFICPNRCTLEQDVEAVLKKTDAQEEK